MLEDHERHRARHRRHERGDRAAAHRRGLSRDRERPDRVRSAGGDRSAAVHAGARVDARDRATVHAGNRTAAVHAGNRTAAVHAGNRTAAVHPGSAGVGDAPVVVTASHEREQERHEPQRFHGTSESQADHTTTPPHDARLSESRRSWKSYFQLCRLTSSARTRFREAHHQSAGTTSSWLGFLGPTCADGHRLRVGGRRSHVRTALWEPAAMPSDPTSRERRRQAADACSIQAALGAASSRLTVVAARAARFSSSAARRSRS